MKNFKLKNMARGWFIGNFPSAAFQTDKCESTYKYFKEGETPKKHFHKISTEINLITTGKALINKKEFRKGDILVVEPKEVISFKALTDTTIITIKIPSIPDDKYLV